MRFTDMKGPIGPVIRRMAAYYAARTPCERDDLEQEAWLAIYRRPHAPHPLAAWTAMRNAIDAETARVARQPRGARPESQSCDHDTPIDARELLAAMDPRARRAAVLLFWHGLTRRDVAARMGVDGSTILRWFRAETAMRA